MWVASVSAFREDIILRYSNLLAQKVIGQIPKLGKVRHRLLLVSSHYVKYVISSPPLVEW